MEELFRTNNTVTISFAISLLKEAGIGHFVADENMGVLYGAFGLFPRRLMVDGEKLLRARRLMEEAGLGAELPLKPVRPL